MFKISKIITAVLLTLAMSVLVFNGVSVSAETVGAFTVEGGTDGIDYTYDSTTGVLTINTATPLTISGTSTSDRIEVASGISANITLSGVSINVSTTSYCAFKIADNSTGNVTVTLIGDNVLKSGTLCAGLQKNGTSGSLTINGSGSLTAEGGMYGAGIGGGNMGNGTNIEISSGTIIATGTTSAAGIGGGKNGYGSNIKITGGNVTATGGSYAAGIGGGAGDYGSNSSYGSKITVSGTSTVVNAKGGDSGGAGIGGGQNGQGTEIEITGGTVTATGRIGAGIGGGKRGSGSGITIDDGKIIATGGTSGGAGIGGGSNGIGSNITINGGEITATGNGSGTGIGGGSDEAGSYITINDGIVTAVATGSYGAAIGGGYGQSGSYITIKGGTVTATAKSSGYSAGIGGGCSGDGTYITITNGVITATGGERAAAIGGGSGGNGTDITISGGTITAQGVKALYGALSNGIGIGGGENAAADSVVTITGASIKALDADGVVDSISGQPTDGTNNVYLLMIENPESKSILINNEDFKPVNHTAINSSDTTLYIYLPEGKDSTVQLSGEDVNTYRYIADKNKFYLVPTADMFTVEFPSDLVYDGYPKTVAVSTDKTGMGTITVKYFDKDGNEVAEPVEAGTYTVKLDVDIGTEYANETGITSESWTFTIGTLTTNAPVIAPLGTSSFKGKMTVTISCEDGAEIYYTTDGSTPTTSSTKYTGPFTIYQTTEVKAIAVKSGLPASTVTAVTYVKNSSSNNTTNNSTNTDTEISSDSNASDVESEVMEDVSAEAGIEIEMTEIEISANNSVSYIVVTFIISGAVVFAARKRKKQ